MAMRTEQELILSSARVVLEPLIAERIKELAGKVFDWDYVLAVSARNGVGPLLYRSLKTLAPDSVPSYVIDKLRTRFYHNVAHNLALHDQLQALLKSFRAAKIDAIPYKGPALATSAYGNIALRVFGDLDVLVQKKDVRRAADLLISLGYSTDLQFTPDQLEAYVQDFNELPFDKTGKAPVELQWEICPDHFVFPTAPLRLWDSGTQEATDESEDRSISPEKFLLMLCVHGAKDSWARLAWICDVAELLRQSNRLDWDSLVKLAVQTGALRMLFLGLTLAHELLDAPVPRVILDRIAKDRAVTTSVRTIRHSLFQDTPQAPPGILETCLFYISMRERLRDKVRFCFRTFSRPVPGQWDQLGLDGPHARISNVIRHVLMGFSYGLDLARQKWKKQGEATTG